MDLYAQQQFGFLLEIATERYVARLEERFRGPAPALAKIKADPEGEGVWLSQFTDAIFEDFLLGNAAGASFVLQALARRSIQLSAEGSVEELLVLMAKQLFAELLHQKTVESLEQHSGYQPV